jgi:ubiquinone/menaquinone biosynthesis C-methylase UbiE
MAKKTVNFVQGSFLDMPFKDEEFGGLVLGEVCEHCDIKRLQQMMTEANRVLRPGGELLITWPGDSRPKIEQHPDSAMMTYCEGVTSWHQSVWTPEQIQEVIAEQTKKREDTWELLHLEPLFYAFIPKSPGWGMCLRKS